MKKKEPKIKYDAEADILSLEMPGLAKIGYASEVGDFIVHFSRTNTPVLIEVLNASKFLKKSERKIVEARELLPTA